MAYSILPGYLLLISLFTFILFGVDKKRARRKKWRIPETQLLLSSFLGGSIGALLGMYVFHHKTRHLKFSGGLPLILIIQVIIGTGVYLFL